jgi:hypothetical protein
MSWISPVKTPTDFEASDPFFMQTSHWLIPGTAVYVLLFMVAVFAIGMWSRSRRRERAPVEFKLLRGPGESLRRRLSSFDENLIFYVGLSATTPLVPAVVTLYVIAKLAPKTNLFLGLAIVGAVFLVGSIISGRWLWGRFVIYRNYKLGYLGERTVAEALMPLVRQGYHIFHDLPASAGERKFNIDHVVVGPTGVFAIETKTRRKGRARPGHKDHEVTFDGQQLIWPWAEDRHGLEQAENEARWLSDWLNKLTGFGVTVRPILALPGWYVKAIARGTVNVVNAKGLCSAVKGRGQVVLTDEQIDIITRQLDERCRDVED